MNSTEEPKGPDKDATDGALSNCGGVKPILPTTDAALNSVKEYLLFSFRFMHAMTSLLRQRIRIVGEFTDEALLESMTAEEFKKIRDESMNPFSASDLSKQVSGVVRCVQGMYELERVQVKAAKKQASDLGIQTFSNWLNNKLGGGLKAKQVIVVQGEPDAVAWTLAAFYRTLLKHNVPITHYRYAASKEDKVPGVKSVPIAWWKDACKSVAKVLEVFKVGSDAMVMLVDSLEALLVEPPKDGTNRIVRYLHKAASHYNLPIIVGAQAHTKFASNGRVIVVPVSFRTIDGKQICMVGEDMCEEKSDGGISVFGGGANTPPAVGSGDGTSASA